MSSPGPQLRWEMTRGRLVPWPMPAPAPSAATGKGGGGHCSVAKHRAGELAAGWDVVPSPALGRAGQGQCGNVTGATTPCKDGRSCVWRLRVMLQGQARLAGESRTGGAAGGTLVTGGEAGACHARGRTWLLPALTLQAPSSGLWCISLFGELKFQLL